MSCRKDLKGKLGEGSSNVVVLCSPLTRTLETAVLASQQLGVLTTDSNFQVTSMRLTCCWICMLHLHLQDTSPSGYLGCEDIFE